MLRRSLKSLNELESTKEKERKEGKLLAKQSKAKEDAAQAAKASFLPSYVTRFSRVANRILMPLSPLF